jgi:hypothetical protein
MKPQAHSQNQTLRIRRKMAEHMGSNFVETKRAQKRQRRLDRDNGVDDAYAGQTWGVLAVWIGGLTVMLTLILLTLRITRHV